MLAYLEYDIQNVGVGWRHHADSGSCKQSERALQKAHVLLEKCQQNKNVKNR